jgi:hypothetical protein
MKNYVTHNQENVPSNNTSLVGHIKVDYNKLVELFGYPDDGDGYKVDAEWSIMFFDGTIATIYNYKNGKNYLGKVGQRTKDMNHWNVGGHNEKALIYVESTLSNI